MYKYREIVCQYCGHRFMWLKDSPEYFIRPDNTIGRQAKCPECGEDLAVFDNELEALPVALLDDSVKRGYEFRI